MDKNVAKKKTTKTTPKKTNVKKSTIVSASKKPPVKVPAKSKTETIEKKKINKPKVEQVECRHCHKGFEKGLTICPFCHKNQKDQTGSIVISVLLIMLLISIIASHFINKYYEVPINEADYKYNSVLTSYEDLVRSPKDYKNKNIKVIGKVIKVEGQDLNYGNAMTVTIDSNLFSGDNKQLITFEYIDEKYELGFIEGDIITVYGEYKLINGNVPFVDAKFVTFGS